MVKGQTCRGHNMSVCLAASVLVQHEPKLLSTDSWLTCTSVALQNLVNTLPSRLNPRHDIADLVPMTSEAHFSSPVRAPLLYFSLASATTNGPTKCPCGKESGCRKSLFSFFFTTFNVVYCRYSEGPTPSKTTEYHLFHGMARFS